MPLTKSEQQVAKDKLRREFAERLARLPHPIVQTPDQIKSIERLMEEWLNAHLDLIVALYREPVKPKAPSVYDGMTEQQKRESHNIQVRRMMDDGA